MQAQGGQAVSDSSHKPYICREISSTKDNHDNCIAWLYEQGKADAEKLAGSIPISVADEFKRSAEYLTKTVK